MYISTLYHKKTSFSQTIMVIDRYIYSRLPSKEFDQSEFMPSYKENLPKENVVLQYAENFRRQYVHLYRDRKPLFLNPVNECGSEVI